MDPNDASKWFLSLFPAETPMKILSSKIQETDGGDRHFTCKLRLALHDKEQFVRWLKAHQELSKVTYRVLRTHPKVGRFITFKVDYRCQHNTLPNPNKVKQASKKHTNCPAHLAVVIKSVPKGECKSKDPYMPQYPTEVVITHTHNHRLNEAESLRFRDPSEEIKLKFLEMFQAGHMPSHALELHKRDLMEEHDETYSAIATDRSICPDIKWVFDLYYKITKAKTAEPFGKNVMDNLRYAIDAFNESGGKAKMHCIGEQIVVAICTPFMQRMHTLKTCGEIVFFDSSGNMDRFNCRVFLLMCDSLIGGLPIGVLMSTSETEEAITAALELYMELMPEYAFRKRGKAGPAFFMTDDCAAIQQSLWRLFPNSVLLLCPFHMLHALWRWLWDPKHGIAQGDRSYLFSLISALVYSKTLADYEQHYQRALEDPVSNKYAMFKEHLQKVNSKSKYWSHYHRRNLLYQTNNSHSIVESAVRILRDKVLFRTRAFSTVQLFNFLSNQLSYYYEQKIIKITSGQMELMAGQLSSSFFSRHRQNLQHLHVNTLNDNLFQVRNLESNNEYVVDMSIGMCSCPIGMTGRQCKHQDAVSLKQRKHLYWIATNSNDIPEEWYGNSGEAQNNETTAGETVTDKDQDKNEETNVADIEAVVPDTKPTLQSTTREYLQNLVDKVMDRFENNPNVYHRVIKNACKQIGKLDADDAVISSLTMLGKTAAKLAPTARKQKTNVSTTGNKRQANQKRNVQPKKRLRSNNVENKVDEHQYVQPNPSEPEAIVSTEQIPLECVLVSIIETS